MQREGSELVEDDLLLALTQEEKLGMTVYTISIDKIGVWSIAACSQRLSLAGLLFCVLQDRAPLQEVRPEVICSFILPDLVKHVENGVAES